MDEKMLEALILLLAGFLVVFAVLIMLILIVTIYSKIIRAAQNAWKKKTEVSPVNEIKKPDAPSVRALTRQEIEEDDDIPPEVIAVIAAAVDAVYGEKPHRVRSVRRSRSSRSAWGRAGALQNTRPF